MQPFTLSLPIIGGLLLFLILGLVVQGIRNRISQLAYQNRLLRALRSLDIAALSTVQMEPLCQAIVDAIHKELGFSFSVIALVDQKAGGIKRIALSYDPFVEGTLRKILPIKFKEQLVPFSETRNFFNRVVLERKIFFVDNLYDIQIGVLPKEVSVQIQKAFNLKGVFLYPLITKDQVIGVLEYPVTIEREKLSKFEYVIMQEFTAEASRALDNVMLYENLNSISKQLEKANTKLMELDRLKDDFVSVTSHELRTPMAAIRSYAWMALHKSDVPLSDKVERYLIRVLLSTERLINLVNDMLNISRIESGRIEINPESVDLIKLVNDIVDEAYYSKGVQKNIHFSILEERLPKVLADPEKLREVMLNILGNAVKFVPDGGSITISFFTDGKVVETSIKDTGPGIAKEDLGKLFKKFGRLDNTYTALATSGGTGLGLYISKSLIELMHGRIWATSEGLGKGTTFTFSLPVAIY